MDEHIDSQPFISLIAFQITEIPVNNAKTRYNSPVLHFREAEEHGYSQ